MKDFFEDAASPPAHAEEDRLRRLSSGFYGLLALAMTMAIGFGSVWSSELLMRLASSVFMAISGIFYLSYFLVDAELLPRFLGAGWAGGRPPPHKDDLYPPAEAGDPPLSEATDLLIVWEKIMWVRGWVRILVVFVAFEIFVFSTLPACLSFVDYCIGVDYPNTHVAFWLGRSL